MENIFFDLNKLRYRGKNVIIGKTVRIRYPELVSIGDNCVIDDFTYISTSLELKNNIHISAGCKFVGGRESLVTIDEYSAIAPGVVLAAGSNDFTGGIATPFVLREAMADAKIGYIHIARHCILGSNTVVLPNITFGEGASIGALSLVKDDLMPWTLYAGIPVRKIKARKKEQILDFEKILESKNTH